MLNRHLALLGDGDALIERADVLRIEACQALKDERRAELGQFLTPPHVAKRMASMFKQMPAEVRLIDPGAGVGILTGAFVERVLGNKTLPKRLELIVFEIEPTFHSHLEFVLRECGKACARKGVECLYQIEKRDFIKVAASTVAGESLFKTPVGPFTHAILNPPYKKLNADSWERLILRKAGIETSNYYAAFVWLATQLLSQNGEIVWISPRSFCNGPYFLPFRKHLLTNTALREVHLFESRETAFGEDEVLQENVIVKAERTSERPKRILIHSSIGGAQDDISTREMKYDEVVDASDKQYFIHLVPTTLGKAIKTQIEQLPNTLADIGISVSTGRVVDFRARQWLKKGRVKGTAPLIYPQNFSGSRIVWPIQDSKKLEAILDSQASQAILIKKGIYVLVKRFSAKEERKRVMAAVYDPAKIRTKSRFVGFENHLNYFHEDGEPLSSDLAKGLCVFLNSSLVDEYLRQFNGHTQVNAFDLRKLRYPSREVLKSLGQRVPATLPEQVEIDRLVHKHLNFMPETSEPIAAKEKIREALTILRALGVPREQQNERSALTLLALLDLKPTTPWASASTPLRGITEMMDFFREHYGKTYAPNTRETVRRQTVHQFVQVGLLIENPDKPDRPINSPSWVYQIEASALSLMRTFGDHAWEKSLVNYLQKTVMIRRLQAKEREMAMLPVRLPDGKTLQLSQGGQNILIKEVLEAFCPRFTPGATVLYVGDAGRKFLVNEVERLAELGVEIDEHGKMPDVVVHYRKQNWLILIEAVTSHGPVNLKRHNELKDLFSKSKAGLVFVTAFPTRKEMNKYLSEIAWETEVWIADAPSHLIHFNGERFLGPHDSDKP